MALIDPCEILFAFVTALRANGSGTGFHPDVLAAIAGLPKAGGLDLHVVRKWSPAARVGLHRLLVAWLTTDQKARREGKPMLYGALLLAGSSSTRLGRSMVDFLRQAAPDLQQSLGALELPPSGMLSKAR